MPSTELRYLRTLLLHRHQWVRLRTRVQNALQAIALGHGLRRGKTLWSQLGQHTITSLPLAPHAAHRRTELLALYGKLQAQIDELDERVRDHAQQRSGAKLLMTTREWGRSRRWPRTCSWVTQRGSKTAKRW
jgi:transposase